MFKYLSRRDEDPGFADAVVLTNKSDHWLVLDDAGRRVPPRSHVAVSTSIAKSSLVNEHVEAGLVVVSGSQTTHVASAPKSKRRKKHEMTEKHDEPQAKAEEVPGTVEEPQVVIADTLVAEPEPQNWVSSNENIVGLPTTDEI